jgi:phosphatidylserine decarboxylase
MVRIGLHHRISSHLISRGGNGSADHSRSGSPTRQSSVGDAKPLILKVNVLKVRSLAALYSFYADNHLQGRNLAAKDRGGTSDPVRNSLHLKWFPDVKIVPHRDTWKCKTVDPDHQ